MGRCRSRRHRKSKEARIIYSKRDEFGSRRPIDVIKANRPIIILDEPQKMGGDVTQKALKNFSPLFTLNYSATHAKQHNLVYVLDALDAFNKRLVKKIEVKGFEVKNFRGTDKYLYLEQIVLSSKKPPMAKLELEIGYNKSINRETRILGVGDNLFYVSQEMEQYKGFVISEIDPIRGCVTFTNGETIYTGDVVGDVGFGCRPVVKLVPKGRDQQFTVCHSSVSSSQSPIVVRTSFSGGSGHQNSTVPISLKGRP